MAFISLIIQGVKVCSESIASIFISLHPYTVLKLNEV